MVLNADSNIAHIDMNSKGKNHVQSFHLQLILKSLEGFLHELFPT